MKFFRSVLRNLNDWPILVVTLLTLTIGLTNIKSGQFLLGWDNTVPELNLAVNLHRTLFSVWQEYRGLGTLDGMAHGANITHWLLSTVTSQLLPAWLVRSFLLVGYHWLGGVGMYLLARYFLFAAFTGDERERPQFGHTLIFLAVALLYQLNLMTLQMFYLPLELFAIHFASLPWLGMALWSYLKKPSAQTALLWIGCNLLFVSQAHVPTIMIAVGILLGIWLLVWLALHPTQWRAVLGAGLLLVITHSFWGLPYLYSALHKAPEIAAATINQFSTDDIYLRNLAWGGLKDVMTFGSFNVDYLDWNSQTQAIQPILLAWKTLYESSWYQLISGAISFLGFVGAIVSMVLGLRKKNAILLSVGLSWLVFLTLLGTNIPFLSIFSTFLKEYVPFFHDIFRFTFTKFSTLYVFTLSLGFGVGLLVSYESFHEHRSALLHGILPVSLSLLLLITVLPIFRGYFFYPELRQTLPGEYQKVSEYLTTSNSTSRALILPIPSLFGWTNNSWGHRGSGFLWQMLPVATLDRAFNPWSAANETVYLQFAHALQQGDTHTFNQLLAHYNIGWIIVDSSIMEPKSGVSNWQLGQIRTLLSKPELSQNLETKLAEGFLTLYEVNYPAAQPSWPTVSAPSKFTEAAATAPQYSIAPAKVEPNTAMVTDPTTATLDSLTQLRSAQYHSFPFKVDAERYSLPFAKPTAVDIPPYSDFYSEATTLVYADQQDTTLNLKLQPNLPNIMGEQDVLASASAQTLSFKLPTTTSSSYFVTFGEETQLAFTATTSPQLVGVVDLPLTGTISARLFEQKPAFTENMFAFFQQEAVAACWQADQPNRFIKKELTNSGQIVLSGLWSSACLSYPFSFTSQDSQKADHWLVGTLTQFTADNSLLRVCFRDPQSVDCRNKDHTFNQGTGGLLTTAVFDLVATDQKTVIDVISSIQQPHLTALTQLQSAELVFLPEIAHTTLSLEPSRTAYDRAVQTISENQTKITTLIWPASLPQVTSQEYWLQNRGLSSAANCDPFGRGEIERITQEKTRTYLAKNKATVCDQYRYYLNSKAGDYLLEIKAVSDSGPGMKINVADPTLSIRETETIITSEKPHQWIPYTAIRGTSNNKVLNLEMTNFGTGESKVELEKLAFIQLPLTWLQKMSPHITSRDNQVTIKTVTKVNPSFYQLKLEVRESGVIALDQAYDQGWLAIAPSNPFSALPTIKINDWQMGWRVEPHHLSLYLIYWPQLISYLGGMVLTTTLIGLVVRHLQTRKKPKTH